MKLDGPIIDTNVVLRLLRSEDTQHPDAVRLLEEARLSTELRGDNIFALARKIGPPVERYPKALYVP